MSIVPVQVCEELGGGHITLKCDANSTGRDLKRLVLDKITQKRRVAGESAVSTLDEGKYRLVKLPLGSTTVDENDPAWPQPFIEDTNMLAQCSLPQEGKASKICFTVALLKGTPTLTEPASDKALEDPLSDLPGGRQRDTAVWRAVPKSELPAPSGLKRGSEMPLDLFFEESEAKKASQAFQALSSVGSQALSSIAPLASRVSSGTASTDGEASDDLVRSPPPGLRRLQRMRGSKDVTMHASDFKRENPNGVAWVGDEDRTNCVCCGFKFTFKKRKHHCRMCGEVVCAECLAVSPTVGYERPQLVCSNCRGKKATATFHGNSNEMDADSFQPPAMDPEDLEAHAAGCLGYLNRLQSSLLSGDQFVRKFYCIRIVAGKPWLWAFDSQDGAEPSEQLPISGSQVFAYARNFFPRVKNSYCFGMQCKGNSEDLVWEAPTEEERAVWLGTLTFMGAEQLSPLPTPKRSPTSMKEGYLEKMGKAEKLSGWGVRYCVLQFNPHRLEYFQTHKDVGKRAPKGVIRLYQEVVLSRMPSGFLGADFSFSIQPEGGRRFLFSGMDDADTSDWLTVLEEVCESEKFARDEDGSATMNGMDLSEVELTGLDVEELEQTEGEHRAEATEREEEIQSMQEELRMLEAELEEENTIVQKDHERLTVIMRILKKDQFYCASQELALAKLHFDLENEEENNCALEEQIKSETTSNLTKQKEVAEMKILLTEREKQLVQREQIRSRKDALLNHHERTWA